mmetsp:Transcript_912/g.1908  ORF Transcript_912/g.1908 Transcript_912/m.1908 type:complete len:211 (-) Transcript_912:58-690(-)
MAVIIAVIIAAATAVIAVVAAPVIIAVVTAPVVIAVVAAPVVIAVTAISAPSVAAPWLWRWRAVGLGIEPCFLHLRTQPVGGLKVPLAFGCHPLVQLVLHFLRKLRKIAATTITIATTIPTAPLARGDDPGADLASEIGLLVVLLACLPGIIGLAVCDEGKALVLATFAHWQLHMLELAILPKIAAQIILASVEGEPTQKDLSAFVICEC